MHYDIQLDEENKVVTVTAGGAWSSATDNAMIRELMTAVEAKGAQNVLLDIRELEFDLPMIQIFERAREMREERLKRNRVSSKVALVYSAANPKLDADMQFFETASRNRGLPYQVFTDVNEAREWLKQP
ncbi:MAG: hypothetical protein JNK32_12205 [Anaerolineales bacterium]|nr:hypothetical protein [Anaerolineales bacterium]